MGCRIRTLPLETSGYRHCQAGSVMVVHIQKDAEFEVGGTNQRNQWVSWGEHLTDKLGKLLVRMEASSWIPQRSSAHFLC